MHAQAYSSIKAARIVGLVDTRKSQTSRAMGKIGIKAPVYSTLTEALAEQDADVVDICLPTPLHEPVALEALKNGKAVFLEKPIARNSAQAQRIVHAAKRAGVAVQIGQCIRFWPEYQALEKIVKSKKLGALKSLTMQRRSALPGYSAGSWLLDEEKSGGAALDLHIHDTDFVLHLLGLPRSVFSQGTRDKHGLSHIFTMYDYKDIAVSAEGGWNYPGQWGFQMAYQAVFERGTIEYDSNQGIFITQGKGPKKPLPVTQPSAGSSRTDIGNVSSLGGYFNELTYFIDCLEKGRMPALATPAQAAESLRVVLAEIESVQRGRIVPIKK